jgi:hypothetical protein
VGVVGAVLDVLDVDEVFVNVLEDCIVNDIFNINV